MELKYMKKFPKRICNEGFIKSIFRHILISKNMLKHDQGKFFISQEESSYCIILESKSITIIQIETY